MAGQKGRSGRKKKPAAQKEREGTYRADRDRDALKFEAGCGPTPQDGLHPNAAAEWHRLVPICLKRGLLTDGDWIAWRLGFSAYSTWLYASEQLAGDPQTWVFTTDSGYECPSPFVAIAKNSWGAVLQFCREFGLTPSARSGLSINEASAADSGDPMAGLIN